MRFPAEFSRITTRPKLTRRRLPLISKVIHNVAIDSGGNLTMESAALVYSSYLGGSGYTSIYPIVQSGFNGGANSNFSEGRVRAGRRDYLHGSVKLRPVQ
jgi:hypothetical protein